MFYWWLFEFITNSRIFGCFVGIFRVTWRTLKLAVVSFLDEYPVFVDCYVIFIDLLAAAGSAFLVGVKII